MLLYLSIEEINHLVKLLGVAKLPKPLEWNIKTRKDGMTELSMSEIEDLYEISKYFAIPDGVESRVRSLLLLKGLFSSEINKEKISGKNIEEIMKNHFHPEKIEYVLKLIKEYNETKNIELFDEINRVVFDREKKVFEERVERKKNIKGSLLVDSPYLI